MIQGNAFGTGFIGGVGRGVLVDAGVTGSLIGGYSTRDRNHLGGATQAAVQVSGSQSSIVGNLIGPGRSGLADSTADNSRGLVIAGNANVIHRNTISGNTSDGILLSGNSNTVRANLIGYNDAKFCTPAPCFPGQGNLARNRGPGRRQQDHCQ